MNKKVLHYLFENIAEEKAANIAVRTETESVSYSELNIQANRLAHLLTHFFIKKDDITTVFLDNRLVQLIAILGIFKSGSVYLPLDQKYSQNYWEELYTKIKPKALLISKSNFNSFLEYDALFEYSIPTIIAVDINNNQLVFSEYKKIDGTYIEKEIDTELSIYNNDIAVEGEDSNYIFFTSGSTGKPKAVLGSHQSLSHFIHWESKELNVTEKVIVGQLTSLSFDASLRDIFVALINGGTICFPSKEIKEDSVLLLEWLKNEKITLLHTIPTMLRLLSPIQNALEIAVANEFPELEYILLAGEKLYAKDITNWRKLYGNNTTIINLYGATESTLVKSFYRIENNLNRNSEEVLPVGQPISNTRILVVNEVNELCRINEKGDIYIKTPFLSKGYYKDAGLTAEKFVQNPLSQEKDIVYKTGDYGKYDQDRNVIVIGREDGMVKLNGVRIDMNSIETVILKLNDIHTVKCMIYNSDSISSSLVCFYESNTISENDLRTHCSKYLSVYEMPSIIFRLTEFPINANGKVDTVSLQNSIQNRLSAEKSIQKEQPVNAVEEKLITLWQEILNVQNIGTEDHFLSLGGNSIKQILLRSKIRIAFNVNLTIEDLFLCPTVCSQAAHILSLPVLESIVVKNEIVPISKNEDGYGISNEQLRIWLASQFEDHSRANNMSYTYNVNGDFKVELYKKALQKIVNRYEILRTGFDVNEAGEVVQKIVDEVEIDSIFDYKIVGQSFGENDVKEHLKSFSNTVFDLKKAPLLQFLLIKISENKFILSTLMHHIIGDYTSDQVIISEVMKLYNAYEKGSSIELNPINVQYKDYAYWIKNRLANNEFSSEKDFWENYLENIKQQPKWYKNSNTENYDGAHYSKVLSAKFTGEIKKYCADNNYNLMGIMTAALSVLIHKISGQNDVIIGAPINLRSHPNLIDQVGLYLNMSPFRVKINGQHEVKEIIHETIKNQIKIFDNSFYPFDSIIEDFDLKNNFNLMERIDLYVNFINHEDKDESNDLDNITFIRQDKTVKRSKFPICFYINNHQDGISYVIEYQKNVFSDLEISKLGERFLLCLEQFLEDQHKTIDKISLVDKKTIPSFSLK
ncbi:condensation domain-containing protein [Flavobacterium sp. MC2016-06]|jgi:amino acid adenylation domain-containing protein|uniref:non-ribosomal peptide synthetase n=1 Tax=Flavobacterium sp. MC2016-06 TaxID=2676308 RepID=UPI0012BAF2DA|nr:non-ribosomal peptide synthetase [Flavobacterium sp. MC2016-06]MBU3862413.1 AMP-binding protein [Flavobacterium sp. MC2016-06]